MKLATPSEMAALEQRSRDTHGITVGALMENAGLRTAQVARQMLRASGGRRVAILAGKGNNGGDGLVAARHLADDGPVRVWLVAAAEEVHGDPAAKRERIPPTSSRGPCAMPT